MNSKMQIPIDAKVLYQIYQYASYANHLHSAEVAGWGHYNNENGIYKLTPLPKQVVSGAEVDTFPNDILSDPEYDISDVVVQWHSHVMMKTYFSAVDTKNIDELMELFPYLISIVVNCKHEYAARLDIAKTAGSNSITLSPHLTLDVELVPYYDDPKVYKECKSKLSKPKPIITPAVTKYYSPPAEYKYKNDEFNDFLYDDMSLWEISDTTHANWVKRNYETIIDELKEVVKENKAYYLVSCDPYSVQFSYKGKNNTQFVVIDGITGTVAYMGKKTTLKEVQKEMSFHIAIADVEPVNK